MSVWRLIVSPSSRYSHCLILGCQSKPMQPLKSVIFLQVKNFAFKCTHNQYLQILAFLYLPYLLTSSGFRNEYSQRLIEVTKMLDMTWRTVMNPKKIATLSKKRGKPTSWASLGTGGSSKTTFLDGQNM